MATRNPTQGILDTNTVILLRFFSDSSLLPDQPLITTVTLAELTVGPLVTNDQPERVARQNVLQFAEANFEPIPFDSDAARAFGGVAATLRSAGRKVSARTYDAMIAAIAISRGLPVYTCNPVDFQGIDSLELVALDRPGRG